MNRLAVLCVWPSRLIVCTMSIVQSAGGLVVVLMAGLLAACGGVVSEQPGGAPTEETAHCTAAPPAVGCRTRVTLNCDAPMPSPVGCVEVASDTGTNIGQEWCCEPAAAVPPQDCAAFSECRALSASLTVCIGGNCACAPPTHPGQNSSTSCFTGEPDVGS